MTAARPAAFAALAALAFVALPTEQAESSISVADSPTPVVRGWSALEGTDTATLIANVDRFGTGIEAAVDAPYCDAHSNITASLIHDFGESFVDHARIGGNVTQLWGSDVMGTWTLVTARADAQTSCVVASGIGFKSGANPDVFYVKAGLAS
ncbi:hypothetical protein GI374_04985 [Paracoccus sp. S-4012]|uniref:hypothetical protein n=1 Tax=Paracoccus sp. S-4012 TaxID=2665648 RepID=UPI0012B0EC00|nr:hypothetical protein [Paracoccus sp. S-4012]MRX49817.1 hypothetical protein [Paracoccus sp. S-4012]